MTLDPDLGWLLDGFDEGELLIHRCADCGAFSEPRALICPVCGSAALGKVAAAGHGRVVSRTTAHGRPGREGSAQGRTFVIVQLEEGPWWWGEVIGAGHERVRAGDQLRLAFRRGPAGRPLPVFCPPDSKDESPDSEQRRN
jgi:uncharacterized OB-fold protein